MIYLVVWVYAACASSLAGDSAMPVAADMAEATQQISDVNAEVQAARIYTEELSSSLRALVCRLQDKDAVKEKHEDVPSGWVIPPLEAYEAPAATCSQLPLRKGLELAARPSSGPADEIAAEGPAKQVSR